MSLTEIAMIRRAIYTMQSIDMFEKLRHLQTEGRTKCSTCTYCTSIAPELERNVIQLEGLVTNMQRQFATK